MDAHGCASSASGPHTQITHDAVVPPLRRYRRPRHVLNTLAFILFVPLTITHYSPSTNDAPSGRMSGAIGVPTSEPSECWVRHIRARARTCTNPSTGGRRKSSFVRASFAQCCCERHHQSAPPIYHRRAMDEPPTSHQSHVLTIPST